jgi:voltage-gated potassium channel
MGRHKNNFAFMLVALMIFLVGVPAAVDLELLPWGVVEALGISSLLAIGIWSLKGTGSAFYIAMSIAIISIILNLMSIVKPGSIIFVSRHFATLAFLMLATVESFRKIASTNTISGNRIIGAICVYFMLGVIWALTYALLEFVIPGSFSGLVDDANLPQNPDWVYFSFVTLTTLGYGDILPLTYLARALAFMEAVVGQFYIAILVAGLVSAHITEKQSVKPD